MSWSNPNVEFYAIRRRDTALRRKRYPFDNRLYDHPHEPLPSEELIGLLAGESGSPRKDEPVSRFGIAGGGSIFSLGGVGGTPTVLPQREFPETRHSLPSASEELKQDVRLLAQESIILMTRDSSNPLKASMTG